MKILMLLNNHFTHDARVLKEARSLANAGYDVTVRCYWDIGLSKAEEKDRFKIERILFIPRQNQKNIFHKIFLLFSFFLIVPFLDFISFNLITKIEYNELQINFLTIKRLSIIYLFFVLIFFLNL